MDPNRVGPAGFKPASQKARGWLWSNRAFLLRCGSRRLSGGGALKQLPMRYRCAAALAHRHAVPRPRIAVDGTIDLAMRAGGRTPDEGEIDALERRAAAAVIGKLSRQRGMRTIVFRDNHQAGRVLIEPVDD